METVSANQDDSSEANPSSVKSEDGMSPQNDNRKSPPPNCAICLGRCRNKSFTDSCLHQFCFKCLVTWSKVKTECPLCKQVFKSIIHNVRSNQQYEEYPVEPPVESTHEEIEIRNLISRRYRFRATLTMPRHESLAFQQFLMQYPLLRAGAAGAGEARRRSSPSSFRRTVYRHNLWARPLPDFTGRFRDCTPEFYRSNTSQMHRLVPWLTRELHYLLNANSGHIAYVLSRVLELLPQHHITSVEFRDAMRCYFVDRTEHFLHELYCFAATPYDITGYDRYVQYSTDSRISTMVQDLVTGSESDTSADSDILVVSSSHPAQPTASGSTAGPSRQSTANPAYPRNYIPQPNNNVIPIETISQSDTDDDSSEVMVVGYIKPPAQRTPEVVDLVGSDSDVVVQETAPAARSPPAARDPSGVRLTLAMMKRPVPMDSDSDESLTPPLPPAPPARRRRRPRGSSGAEMARSPSPCSGGVSTRTRSITSSVASATAYDSFSSPVISPTSSGFSGSVASTSASTTDTYTSSFASSSSSSDERNNNRSKKKTKKTAVKQVPKRNKSKAKKRSPRRQRKKSDDRTYEKPKEKDSKNCKRKSRNGKGVKSSKKGKHMNGETSERSLPAADQPGPSDVNVNLKRKSNDGASSRSNRDNKRLKSVVNVMNRNEVMEESFEGPSGAAAGGVRTRRMTNSSNMRHGSSDSDDNVPLNLTLHRI